MYNQTIKTTRDEDMSNKTIAEALIKAQQFEDVTLTIQMFYKRQLQQLKCYKTM